MNACSLPPPKPKMVQVCNARKVERPAPPKGVQTAESNDSGSASKSGAQVTASPVVNVRVYTVPARASAPLVAPRRYTLTQKPASTTRRFTLMALAGASPTSHTVSETQCDVRAQTCKVDVRRRYVFDAGVGLTYRITPEVSAGVVGTFRGSVYGVLGFSF